jgi:transcriptional regulator with XRE-family HTH domain
MIWKHIMTSAPDALLKDLGLRFRKARLAAGLSQEQIAQRANISRPRYRDIETGAAAARATTLVNVARALGMEMMLIPQAIVPAVQSMLQPADNDDDRPAFTSDVEEEEGS